jgi:hypothetical protein
LFIDLGADEEQIDFPVLYAISRDGIAKKTLEEESKISNRLFDQIIETIPAPKLSATTACSFSSPTLITTLSSDAWQSADYSPARLPKIRKSSSPNATARRRKPRQRALRF